MKLYERLPDSVTVNGKRIRCDFDFRNVLRMLETLAREDLTEEARAYRAVRCVTKRVKADPHAMLDAIYPRLFAEKKTEDGQRVTDFEQDADYIRAAFLQEYGINLFRDRLHWCEFASLLACLPEGSRYVEILGIRSRPMPAATKWNAEERKWLAKAKAQFALTMTEEEKEKSLEASLRAVAFSLLSMAEKGGNNGVLESR